MICSLSRPPGRRQGGFSLTELLIVVAIVGILAAIGFPAYTDYARRTKRADAKEALSRMAQLQERFFTENNRYANNATELGYGGDSPASPQQYWTVSSATTDNSTTYTLTASVNGTHTDPSCDGMTLNAQGAVTPDPTDVALTAKQRECWAK